MERSRDLHPKERVIGLVLDDKAKAWPFVEQGKLDAPLQARVGDTFCIILLCLVTHFTQGLSYPCANEGGCNGPFSNYNKTRRNKMS
jgi:hypothetical protein